MGLIILLASIPLLGALSLIGLMDTESPNQERPEFEPLEDGELNIILNANVHGSTLYTLEHLKKTPRQFFSSLENSGYIIVLDGVEDGNIQFILTDLSKKLYRI